MPNYTERVQGHEALDPQAKRIPRNLPVGHYQP
jgi:hypothetical protein